jgi:hypothetical protein
LFLLGQEKKMEFLWQYWNKLKKLLSYAHKSQSLPSVFVFQSKASTGPFLDPVSRVLVSIASR